MMISIFSTISATYTCKLFEILIFNKIIRTQDQPSIRGEWERSSKNA